MSLTSGFFNSLNHDRKYNAIQMSSIFDGIIRDGVFMSITDKLMVEAESGMTIVSKPGRAWFDHTWTLNDAKLPLVVEQSELILDRIDAVVLEVNKTQSVRSNTIKMVKGTPSATPQNPTLTKSLDVNQYPLAYVSVKHGVTEITQADITNMVGTSECPFVTGILETISIDDLVAQWKSEWEIWITEMKQSGEDWQNQVESEFEAWSTQQKEEFTQFVEQFEATMQIFQTNSEEAFNKWFVSVKDILDENTAGNLLNLINEIKNGLPNATATHNGSVVAIVSNPTTAKSIYFYAPSNFLETDTYTLNGLPLTITDLNGEPINNAWKAGSPVSLIIKGNIGFFKSGGGGRNDTLPPMVTELKAVAGNQTIELMWKNPISEALAGILVTYNQNRIPEHPFDGTKIDVGKNEKTTIGFLNNGTEYFIRIFPYNSKKQYQTVLDGATISAIPSEGPLQVTNLEITGSGSSPILSWKNPIDDPTYHETVVIQKEDSAPTSLSDGTEIYRGNGETVSPEGLERLHNYYWGVFTVNTDGGTQGPVVSDVYSYDFPAEPTEYLNCAEIPSSTEYGIPEDGWFRIDAIGAGGTGGTGINFDTTSWGKAATCGGGGIGGHARSEIPLNKGDILKVVIDSGNVTVSCDSKEININVLRGSDGNKPSGYSPGLGGEGGKATGGNIENNKGQNGDIGTLTDQFGTYLTLYGGSEIQKIVQINRDVSFTALGGKAADYKRSSFNSINIVSNASSGSVAKVFISRGNTNIPSPSQVSALSLIPKNNSVEATWKNSGDPVQTGTMLVYNTSHTPKSPSDGVAVDIPLTQPVTLALNSNSKELQEDSKKQSYTITGVPNDKPVFVALFPYDKDRKYGLAKQEVEIPREHSWYNKQQELEAEVETVKAEMADYQSYYTTTQEVLK